MRKEKWTKNLLPNREKWWFAMEKGKNSPYTNPSLWNNLESMIMDVMFAGDAVLFFSLLFVHMYLRSLPKKNAQDSWTFWIALIDLICNKRWKIQIWTCKSYSISCNFCSTRHLEKFNKPSFFSALDVENTLESWCKTSKMGEAWWRKKNTTRLNVII